MRTIGQTHPFAAAVPGPELLLLPGATADSVATTGGAEGGGAAVGCSIGVGSGNVAVLLGGSQLLLLLCCCGCENGS